jgi:hypothetical protein
LTEGIPFLTNVARTNESIVTSIGAGTPVITSYKGRAGTGIVWIVDLNLGLTAYKAVPESNAPTHTREAIAADRY